MFDPKYKLKHRVTPVRRLLRYERYPPPMIGDPRHGKWGYWRSWDERCRVIYEAMMKQKRGGALWMWSWNDAPQRSDDALLVVSHAVDMSVVDNANV